MPKGNSRICHDVLLLLYGFDTWAVDPICRTTKPSRTIESHWPSKELDTTCKLFPVLILFSSFTSLELFPNTKPKYVRSLRSIPSWIDPATAGDHRVTRALQRHSCIRFRADLVCALDRLLNGG